MHEYIIKFEGYKKENPKIMFHSGFYFHSQDITPERLMEIWVAAKNEIDYKLKGNENATE